MQVKWVSLRFCRKLYFRETIKVSRFYDCNGSNVIGIIIVFVIACIIEAPRALRVRFISQYFCSLDFSPRRTRFSARKNAHAKPVNLLDGRDNTILARVLAY